ncbi:MAG: DUF1929 domain-containing protein [Candidatus Binataceae bacterium]|nr:DUF1929 domain-containing protein [Candidatus Binataceae bacterium]
MKSRPSIWLTLLGLLLTSFALVTPAFAVNSMGQWSADSPWPTVGVSLAVLPDGRISTWGEDIPAPGTTAFNTFIVTIPSGSTDTSAVQTLVINDDMFCGGFTFLPDGRLIVVGGGDQPAPTNGTGRATTDILDPATSIWSSGPAMSGARWYPTATVLPSGDVLALLGSIDMNFTTNETPDVIINDATAIRSLTGVSTATLYYNYPRAFVAPNGEVFLSGMEQTTRYLDTSGAGAYTTVASSIFGTRAYGSAVMYDVGKVLIVGGATSDGVATPTNTAEVIDLNAQTPAWRNVGPMAYARRYLNATLMADGKVLITGGNSNSASQGCAEAVLPAEIWDPATERFTTVASMPHYRVYHSSAVLLPDGRVLSAGTTAANGTCGGIDYKDADFYSPPYLFNGTQPTISSAPKTINYGAQFSIGTPNASAITNVNLIALGAATHHFNFNQRISRLTFTKATNSLNVIAPTSSSLAPPGDYMLFILNSAGVPSVASIVQVSGGASPAVQITAPLNGATVSGNVAVATNVASSVTWVNYYIDGNYYSSSPPTSFSWNSASVPFGPHSITARAFSSGDVQIGSDAVTVNVTSGAPTPTPTSTPAATPTPTPTPKPTPTPTRTASPTPTTTPTPSSAIAITAPGAGASVSGNVTITTQVSSSVSWINVYIDGNYFASSPPYTFTWNSTTVPNGSHTISASAYNSSGGKIGSAAVSVNVTNGSSTPTPTATPTPSSVVAITAPAGGASVSGTVTIATQFASSVTWINVYIDGNYFASSPPSTFTWNSTTVPNGSHTISATAFNSSDAKIGSASVSVSVTN